MEFIVNCKEDGKKLTLKTAIDFYIIRNFVTNLLESEKKQKIN